MTVRSTTLRSARIGCICTLTAIFASVGVVGCGGGGAKGSEATISISRPESGALVSESRIRVRGSATGVDRVTVNGRETEVVGGVWKVLVEFEEGPATVTAKGGGARAVHEFTVDSHAPTLELEAPARATYVGEDRPPKITVNGRVEDGGSGLRLLSVEGEAVEVASDGTFEARVELEPGLEVLRVEAFDRADNRSNALRGVVYGPLEEPTSRIDPGFRVGAAPSAVDTAATVAEQYLTPQRITEFARQNLENENFTLREVEYRDLDLQLALGRGHLDARVDIDTLVVEGDAILDGSNYPVVVTIDRASWSGDLHIEVDTSNRLVFEIRNPALQLDKEDFHFALRDSDGDKQNVDVDALRQLAVNVVRRSLTGAIEGEALGALWDRSVLKREVRFMGRSLVFRVVPTELRIRPGGLVFEGAVAMPEDRASQVREVPGALDRELGSWRPSDLGSDAAIWTNRTAIERIAHGVWRAGLFHRSLRNRDLSAYDLPVDLNAEALAVAIDQRILGLADGDTPAVIRLRPLLPPVAQFSSASSTTGDAASAKTTLRMAEFMVDVMLRPDSGTPLRIASVAVFLDLGVDVSLDGFALNLSFAVDARADVHAEPELDFDDAAIEEAVAGIMKAVPKLVGDELTVVGESDLRWVDIRNPKLSVEGRREDRAKFSVDLAPNPDGVQP